MAAGYPEATEGVWSDAMTDGAVIWGDESRAAEAIAELFPSAPPKCRRHPLPLAPTKLANDVGSGHGSAPRRLLPLP